VSVLDNNAVFYGSLALIGLGALWAMPLKQPPQKVVQFANTGFRPIPVEVFSDPGVKYFILEIEKRPDRLIEVTSRREGKSGISFAKRLVNCDKWTFKYLAEGDTLEELNIPRPDPEMGKLTDGSISMVLSYRACENAGLVTENASAISQASAQPQRLIGNAPIHRHSFANCSAARAAGAAPVYRGEPGYGSHLDRDNDGIGCE
jgi:hypothetical protein